MHHAECSSTLLSLKYRGVSFQCGTDELFTGGNSWIGFLYFGMTRSFLHVAEYSCPAKNVVAPADMGRYSVPCCIHRWFLVAESHKAFHDDPV